MKNIVLISLCSLFLATAHSQISDNYSLEIWSAEIYHKDSVDFIELDVFNNGSKYDSPTIQIMHGKAIIGNPKKNKEDVVLQPRSIHKFELPVELPKNYDGKKIKLEIVISNEAHTLAKKLKVKID